jgi:methyl-accepting chemotaxis protein
MFGFRTIRSKAWLVAALMLIPQALQGYVIWTRAQVDISFAAKERVGVDYMRALFPVHQALDGVIATQADLKSTAAVAEGLKTVALRHDGMLDTSEQSKAVLASLVAGQSVRSYDLADKEMERLIGKVGDQSNLILDPDLDTYYLMSMVVERIPEITRHAARARSVFADERYTELGVRQSDLLGFSIGNMNGQLPKLMHGGKMAITSTKDAAVVASVAKALQSAESATITFSETLTTLREAVTLGTVSPSLRKALSDSSEALVKSYKELHAASLISLESLLETRISGFEWSRNRDILVILVVISIVYFAAFTMTKRVLASLWQMRISIESISAGHNEANTAMSARRDEIGAIGRAIDRMRDAVMKRLAENFSTEKEEAIIAEQRRSMQELALVLESSVSGSIGQIDRLAAELKQAVAFVDESARNTGMAVDQSSASMQTSIEMVRGAADGLQELSISTSEIASQTSRAAVSSRDAMAAANETLVRADEFERTVLEINGIVRFVEQIAQQTNLLALNATIEAARAGAAGRGFAVVASEVKVLAQQTAQATQDIAAKVAAVSQVGAAMGASVRSVVVAIQSVDEVATSIAAAVEEHDVTTADINQRIQTTVADSVLVAHQIEEVAGLASSTREVSEDLAALSAKMEREAQHLSDEMRAFMAKIAA